MRIRHASISNFRALHEVEVPLRKFSVILGENDVGKTSFLRALDAFFACKKITSKDDFFMADTSAQIVITLTFDGLDGESELDAFKRPDGTLVVRRTFEFQQQPKTACILADGSERELPRRIQQKILSSNQFHFIPVRRDLAVQFSMAKTALLGKTIRARMRKAVDDGAESLEAVEALLRDAIDGPRNRLQELLCEQMHSPDIRLGFDELCVDPVEGVSFAVTVSDARAADIIIENRGAGTQNNLIIALFRLVAEIDIGGSFIFAMEEPENSLHPKAQRQLATVLQQIGKDSQVIVTTHSPVLVERSSFENNIILTRQNVGRTVARTFRHEMLEELRRDLGIRPSDALLKGGGNCALLVEGNSEEEAVPVFMEMLDLSEFQLGISVINMRGSDSDKVLSTARLLGAYDIPCVVLLDKDAEGTAQDVRRAADQGDLANVRDVIVLTEGSLEDYYPLEIVAEVMNREFSPTTPVSADDFDPSKRGEQRLSDFARVLREKSGAESKGYLKRHLGSLGTELMRSRGYPVPPEIEAALRAVVRVVEEH